MPRGIPNKKKNSKLTVAKNGDMTLTRDKTTHDEINHPSHYTFGKFEVIHVLMDWFPTNPLLWQVGKYIARANHKGQNLKDLKKAQFYLNEEINRLENL